MEVVVLPSAVGGFGQPLSTYVINGCVAIDAGSLGLYGTIEEQSAITDVLLTHSHLDHVAGLPMLVDNVYEPTDDCVTVHGSAATLDSLHRDIFNDRLYPDMIAMSERMPPFLRVKELDAGRPMTIQGLQITAISVNHVVPCVAFIISSVSATIAIITDTAPTEQIWRELMKQRNLAAVFLECSFPNRHIGIARAAMHLTPALFFQEIAKAPAGVPIHVIHIKPRFYKEVIGELSALGDSRVQLAEPSRVYKFGTAD